MSCFFICGQTNEEVPFIKIEQLETASLKAEAWLIQVCDHA